jgi:hypothetical protein
MGTLDDKFLCFGSAVRIVFKLYRKVGLKSSFMLTPVNFRFLFLRRSKIWGILYLHAGIKTSSTPN